MINKVIEGMQVLIRMVEVRASWPRHHCYPRGKSN